MTKEEREQKTLNLILENIIEAMFMLGLDVKVDIDQFEDYYSRISGILNELKALAKVA